MASRQKMTGLLVHIKYGSVLGANGDGNVGPLKVIAFHRWYYSYPESYLAAIHSTSTRAPFGRVLTATALLAGKGAAKNWA